MATILCIDDEPVPLGFRCELLKNAGYNVRAVRSAQEGVQVFASEHIDLVVLDYWMAGKNGLELADELKRIKSAVPMVILSGYYPILHEAIGRVERWLVKGQPPEELLATIDELLSRAPEE